MYRKSLSLLVLAFVEVVSTKADTVVNRCGMASDPGGPAGSVDLARALASGGRITFACPSPTVIVVSTSFAIVRNTEIDGAGSVTLDVQSPIVMFALGAGSPTLTLTALAMHGGGPGAVVSGRGTVIVSNSNFVSTPSPIHLDSGKVILTETSFANVSGPVISAPSISIRNVNIQTLSGAVLVSSGGLVRIDHSVMTGGSGSVFDACQLRILGSDISATSASAVTTGCDTSISTTTFRNNRSANGGALFVRKNAAGLSVSASTFSGNAATAQGGAMAFEPSAAKLRTLRIANVTFEGNTAADGGAIHLGSFLENNNILLGNSLIFGGNAATNTGGAIAGTNAQLSLTRTMFARNSAGKSGGAIQNSVFGLRPTVISNTVFTANSAPVGSAIMGASIQLLNVTVTNNLMGAAITPFWASGNPNAPQPAWFITLHNVALSNNAGASCDNNVWKGLLQDGGQNLQFPESGCPASIPIGDPSFDALLSPAWNGAAMGRGDLTTCVAQPVGAVDLFGRYRPQGQSCSIGAVEGDLQSAVQQNGSSWDNPPAPPQCPCVSSSPIPQPLPPSTVTSIPQLPPPAAPPTSGPGQPPSTNPQPYPSTDTSNPPPN